MTKQRTVRMESTRERCRVEKKTGPASCQCVRTRALQKDLCLGWVCSTVVFGSLKTHRRRRTDPVTPITHVSELEAWAIVTFPPIVPWERMTSVPASCCSGCDKTTLLNIEPTPLLNTHMHTRIQKTGNGCTTDNLFTHTHSYLIHTFLDTWKALH